MKKLPSHLEHLRRDRRGLPVPYINRWGPEDPTRVSIGHDANVGGPAFLYDDSGFGEPDFTAQHFDRQRECMAVGLCQVCANHVPWSRRFLVLASLSVETITVHGRKVAAVTEPWLCGRCAEFATEVCPALIRRRREEQLIVVPITSKRQVQFAVSYGYVDGPLSELSKQLQPAMWVKAIVSGVDVVAERTAP